MNILIILENFYPRIGGVETFFLSLVNHLDKAGHQVTVLTNKYDTSLPREEKIGQKGRIIRQRYYNRYLFTFGAWWHAIKLAKKADLIHTTSYNAAVPARMAAKFTKTKSIITFHERWGDLWDRLPWMSNISKQLHKRFESWICSFRFDRFVAVSDYTKFALIDAGVMPGRINRIYNGMTYKGYPIHKGSESEQFTFLFYGRLGYAKGVDLLLQAYYDLVQLRKDHQLLMIIPSEEQPTTSHVEALIAQLGLSGHITIMHDLPYEELIKQIAKASAVVIPSYSEGFCFAAAETIAIGTPLISSGQGALAEVVSGKHITAEEFSSEGMMKAMIAALGDRWVKTPVKKFELQDTVAAYTKLYDAVLSED